MILKKLIILSVFYTLKLSAAFLPLQYANFIYEGDIRTVQLYQTESGFNAPIIPLGTMEGFTLEFDQITNNQDYYQYTLIHCDYNWNPTAGLSTNQYLEGMGYEDIPNPIFSTTVLTQYVHYKLPFPTDNVKPKFSGNYLLVVYRNYDKSDIVITRRVLFFDSKGSVQVDVKQSPIVETRYSHQQVLVDFNNNQGYFIPRPYEDVHLVLMQNFDWNTALYDVHPQFISGTQFKYTNNTGNLFNGLNEYRYFDIRSLIGSAANVKERYNINNQKHVELIQEYSRKPDNYLRWSDYNGRYLIYNRDLTNIPANKIGTDYCFIHFNLKADELPNKRVFIYGELSDWRIQPNYECYYNSTTGCYEAIIQLKQAYYNYMYATVDENESISFIDLEGGHSQTENNYSAFIYHKNQTLGYDELIGYGLGNSQENR